MHRRELFLSPLLQTALSVTDEQLAGLHPSDFIEKRQLFRDLSEAKFSGGNIRDRQTDAVLPAPDSSQEVVSAGIERLRRGDGSRRNDANDFSLHDALGGFWV